MQHLSELDFCSMSLCWIMRHVAVFSVASLSGVSSISSYLLCPLPYKEIFIFKKFLYIDLGNTTKFGIMTDPVSRFLAGEKRIVLIADPL